jgi:hypothetical protein
MYIKMVGDTTKYHGALERMGDHLIKVSGLIQHTSGFRLYQDNDVLIGDYSTFVYPYLDPNLGEGVYEYSDNNMDYEKESTKPSKEEEERKKIENIILNTVGGDINSLTQQMSDIVNILTPMYEVILDIQEAIQPQDEPIPSEDETPNDDGNNNQPIEDEVGKTI